MGSITTTRMRGVLHLTVSILPAALRRLRTSARGGRTAYCLHGRCRNRRAHRQRQGRLPPGLPPDRRGRRVRERLGRRPPDGLAASACARRASRCRSRAATCSSSRTARGPSAFIRAGPRPAASRPPRSPPMIFLRRARPTKGASACIAATCRRPSCASIFRSPPPRSRGTLWEIENVAVKPFPACHFVHACADAAIALHRPASIPSASLARCARARRRRQGGVRAGRREAPAEERLRREVQHSLRGRERPRTRPPRPGGVRARAFVEPRSER